MGQERRTSERFSACVPVEFCGVVVAGEGTMVNGSLSGARIEQVTCLPARGQGLRLLLSMAASEGSLHVRGEVTRHTETGGFAVRFCELDARTLRILRTVLPRMEELSQKLE